MTVALIAVGMYMSVACWLLILKRWTPGAALLWPVDFAFCAVILAIVTYDAFDSAMKRRGL